MFVERCWICLEQPAATSVRMRDGREYPACDICAAEQAPATTPAGSDAVTDETWARIVEELS